MRLFQFLKEARVKQTDADVFLEQRAPMFMWSPKVGLLWAAYDKARTIWRLYHNNKEIDPLEWKYYDEYEWEFGMDMFRHQALYSVYANIDTNKSSAKTQSFIRGRIHPNGSEIYIHDLNSREYNPMIKKRFDYYVDKTLNAVYKYMEKYIR